MTRALETLENSLQVCWVVGTMLGWLGKTTAGKLVPL
jgi:hypothetical protein